MRSRFFFAGYLIIVCFIGLSGSLSAAPGKIKSVLKKPYKYEYPGYPVVSNTKPVNKPWVVYSARSENTVYGDKLLKYASSKAGFLDSFYVASTSGTALELIRYKPDMLDYSCKIIDPAKIEYAGWMDESALLLSDRGFMNTNEQMPLKYITMLNGSKVLETFKKSVAGNQVRVFSDPELTQEILDKATELSQLVYVYREYKGKILIGTRPVFSPGQGKDVILGWVPRELVQAWGTGLCITPLEDGIQNYLFSSSAEAQGLKNNLAKAIKISGMECNLGNPWPGLPVFGTSTTRIRDTTYRIIHTGAVLNPFTYDNAHILNVKGNKITYGQLCEFAEKSRNINLVFALNMGNDTKEFMPVLLNAFLDLEQYFKEYMQGYSLSFAVYDCSGKPGQNKSFHTSYPAILPSLIDITKESVEGNKPASPNGIVNGLGQVAGFFAGREKETNIVLVISSRGDANIDNSSYRQRLKKAGDDLAAANVRPVFFQPYSASNEAYTALIMQAKNILERVSESVQPQKRIVQVGNMTEKHYSNAFRNPESGATNVYCLDYPDNAAHQGFLIFPTVGTKTDGKYLTGAFDSLLVQIEYENKRNIESIRNVFNSPAVFNNQVNTTFTSYCGRTEKLGDDLAMQCRNFNFSYFVPGYSISPVGSKRFYGQSLLLTSEEYESLVRTFKGLRFDLLLENQGPTNRNSCYTAIVKALDPGILSNGKTYYNDQPIATFFSKALRGYIPQKKGFNSIKIGYLEGSKTYMTQEQFVQAIEEINARLNRFYSVRNNSNAILESGGERYYLISEDYLP